MFGGSGLITYFFKDKNKRRIMEFLKTLGLYFVAIGITAIFVYLTNGFELETSRYFNTLTCVALMLACSDRLK